MNERLAQIADQIKRLWAGLPPASRWMYGGVLAAALLALVWFVSAYGGGGRYEVLFSRLMPTDAAEVIAVLEERNVPYRLADNGREIWAPTDQVTRLRLDLAGLGLPRGGTVGFEKFDQTRLGMTDFDRQVWYLVALQGEIARTLQGFDQVRDARVHLTLPQPRLFSADRAEPTASVVLDLYPGATMGPTQVRAISHLLERSVEGLRPENISIIDQRGEVLSDMLTRESGLLSSDTVRMQLQIRRELERDLASSLERALEAVYGAGRVVARVSAEINFDLIEEESERFGIPEGSRTPLIRSQQLEEERFSGAGSAPPGGVPGVDANIPGYPGFESLGESELERRFETTNFEMDRLLTLRRAAPGSIERLSVAVWIDRELDDAQRSRLEQSVAATLGLVRERGDVVAVESVPFEAAAALAPVEALPASWTAQIGWWIVLAVVLIAGAGALIWLWRQRTAPEPEPEAPMAPEDFMTPEELERQAMRDRVMEMARRRPQDMAQLLKSWLAEE